MLQGDIKLVSILFFIQLGFIFSILLSSVRMGFPHGFPPGLKTTVPCRGGRQVAFGVTQGILTLLEINSGKVKSRLEV